MFFLFAAYVIFPPYDELVTQFHRIGFGVFSCYTIMFKNYHILYHLKFSVPGMIGRPGRKAEGADR